MRLAMAAWIVAVLGAGALIWDGELKPGAVRPTPVRWPEQSHLVRAAELPTLVVFGHPQCGCTRATLNNLRTLQAKLPGRFAVRVAMTQPADAPQNWFDTDTVRLAREVAGGGFHAEDGLESRRFGAETSGTVLLYASDGHLLFSGGITDTRSHEGVSRGLIALEELLTGARTEPVTGLPVFGCALRG
ncbi:MAG: hypothetical protein JST92_17960 [Deltaproteobacteria bacterium]|nr:hypothetical protein [Deltaproteobacteria bacterium]